MLEFLATAHFNFFVFMSCWKKHTLVFFLFGEFLAAVQFNCFLFMGFWTKHIVVLLWFRCGIYCSSPFQLFCFHGLLYKKRIVFFCLSVEFLAQSISIVLFSWIVVHKRDCLLLFRCGISCTAHFNCFVFMGCWKRTCHFNFFVFMDCCKYMHWSSFV